MFLQHPVRNFSVSDQLDGTVVRLQLFCTDQVRIMIMQVPVDTSDSLHIGTDSSQIVRYHDYAQRFIEFFQDGVKFLFEITVYISRRFVEDQDAGRRNDRPAKEYPLHLSAR